jgi:hypothetical protein
MPAANPLIHQAPANRGYVNSTAQEGVSSQAIKSAEIMPMQLALLLLGSAAGLWALKQMGFRFVVEVGKAGK